MREIREGVRGGQEEYCHCCRLYCCSVALLLGCMHLVCVCFLCVTCHVWFVMCAAHSLECFSSTECILRGGDGRRGRKSAGKGLLSLLACIGSIWFEAAATCWEEACCCLLLCVCLRGEGPPAWLQIAVGALDSDNLLRWCCEVLVPTHMCVLFAHNRAREGAAYTPQLCSQPKTG